MAQTNCYFWQSSRSKHNETACSCTTFRCILITFSLPARAACLNPWGVNRNILPNQTDFRQNTWQLYKETPQNALKYDKILRGSPLDSRRNTWISVQIYRVYPSECLMKHERIALENNHRFNKNIKILRSNLLDWLQNPSHQANGLGSILWRSR